MKELIEEWWPLMALMAICLLAILVIAQKEADCRKLECQKNLELVVVLAGEQATLENAQDMLLLTELLEKRLCNAGDDTQEE